MEDKLNGIRGCDTWDELHENSTGLLYGELWELGSRIKVKKAALGHMRMISSIMGIIIMTFSSMYKSMW
jgi:hypothetical protein